MQGWTGAVLKDWQFTPILRASSGAPLNITKGTDNSLTGVGLARISHWHN